MNIPHLAKSRDLDNTRTRYCFELFNGRNVDHRGEGGRPFISLRFAGLYFFTTFSRRRVKKVSLSLSLSSRPSLGARSSSVQSPLLLSSFNVCAGDKDKLVCRIKRNHVEKCIRVFVEFSTSAISKESRRI